MTDKQLMEHDILKEPMALGDVFVASGLFPDIKTQAQAVVKILAGKEMGLTPFESMNNLYLVNGKIGVMSNAMASIIQKSGKYDYIVKEHTEEVCSIEFFRIDDKERISIGVSTFDLKNAAKAGIINSAAWKNYPRNLLFARALSNGARWFCPGATANYCVEELEDIKIEKPMETITISSGGEVSNEGNLEEN